MNSEEKSLKNQQLSKTVITSRRSRCKLKTQRRSNERGCNLVSKVFNIIRALQVVNWGSALDADILLLLGDQ